MTWEDILAEEQLTLTHVREQLVLHAATAGDGPNFGDFDRELLNLRDQLADTRAEDHAMLVEHMTRLAALRSTAGRGRTLPPDPDNPYFAHLRLRESDRIQDLFIGRRAFIDPKVGIHIVDWRNSPISRIFYRYQEGDDYEESFGGQTRSGRVELRRTLTVREGKLVRVRSGEVQRVLGEDGQWRELDIQTGSLSGGMGTALRAPEIRLGKGADQRLPEITALIDPSQFAAITEERSGVVIIRGGAGTGKTTIALHRAAYLHYNDPKKFHPKNMLMITPGIGLARYVAKVLPSLDVEGTAIKDYVTFAQEACKRLLPKMGKRKFTDDTPTEARRLKRHPALLRLLERAVADAAREYDDVFTEAGGEVVGRAWVSRRTLAPMPRLRAFMSWAATAPEAQRVLPDLKTLANQAASVFSDPTELWASLLTDKARLRAGFAAFGEHPYEWALDQLVDTVSKQSDEPPRYGDLDEDRRTGIDGQELDRDEITGRLDVDDLAILIRLCQLFYGSFEGPSGPAPYYEHLIVDEAQDFAPLWLKTLLDAVRPGGPVTLAGDTAQRIYFESGFDDWDVLIKDLQIKAHSLPALDVSYRSTRQVMELARHVLGPLQVNPLGRDARDGAPVTMFRFVEQGEAVAFLSESLSSLRRRERNASVALVARTPGIAELYYRALDRAEVTHLRHIDRQNFDFTAGVDVTDIYQIKGLEYDYVVLLEPTVDCYPDSVESRHLLHVGATRAAHQLWMICSGTPSPLLPDELRKA